MKQRILNEAEVLLLKNIHSHWRIDKSNSKAEAEEIEAKIDIAELLRVNKPAIVKSLNRPFGVKNKKKRTRLEVFEDSIQREPSEFEHI